MVSAVITLITVIALSPVSLVTAVRPGRTAAHHPQHRQPPERRKRTTRAAASSRKTMFRYVV